MYPGWLISRRCVTEPMHPHAISISTKLREGGGGASWLGPPGCFGHFSNLAVSAAFLFSEACMVYSTSQFWRARVPRCGIWRGAVCATDSGPGGARRLGERFASSTRTCERDSVCVPLACIVGIYRATPRVGGCVRPSFPAHSPPTLISDARNELPRAKALSWSSSALGRSGRSSSSSLWWALPGARISLCFF